MINITLSAVSGTHTQWERRMFSIATTVLLTSCSL